MAKLVFLAKLNSLAGLSGGRTLETEAGAVLVVVVVARGTATCGTGLDAAEVFVDIATNVGANAGGEPGTVSHTVPNGAVPVAVGWALTLARLLVEEPSTSARGVGTDAPAEWTEGLWGSAAESAALAVAFTRWIVRVEDPVSSI